MVRGPRARKTHIKLDESRYKVSTSELERLLVVLAELIIFHGDALKVDVIPLIEKIEAEVERRRGENSIPKAKAILAKYGTKRHKEHKPK